MGIGVVFGTAVVVAIFPTNAGLAGLALTSALNLTGTSHTELHNDRVDSISTISIIIFLSSFSCKLDLLPFLVPMSRPPSLEPSCKC